MIIAIIFAVVTATFASSRGYSMLAWFLAGGLIGLIIIACLPNVKQLEGTADPAEVSKLRIRGNVIGAVMSVLSILLGVVLAVFTSGKS